MSAFCTFVSLVCTSLNFCVTCLHFSALQTLLVTKSDGTSAFILFVSTKCTNKIKETEALLGRYAGVCFTVSFGVF